MAALGMRNAAVVMAIELASLDMAEKAEQEFS